jgi:hypothetical protein
MGDETRAYNLLTRRKKEFAKLVADGVKQVDAYERVYGIGNGSRKTRHELSSDLARRPEVQAEIARYAQEMLPIGDMRVVKQEMLQTMRGLAIGSSDDRVRLAAAKELHDICEKREEQDRHLLQRAPVSVETLLEELSALRGREPATLEMEVVEEQAGEPESD